MTRTYAVRRLLELGPLTYGELRDITGWPSSTIHFVLNRLGARRFSQEGTHGILYGLA